MSEFNSIEEVSQEIRNKLDSNTDKKSIALLYAFNGTGKTRISSEFDLLNYNEEDESVDIKKVLSYNAFFEDLFSWDNENNILNFSDSWEKDLIKNEGLEGKIIKNFKLFLNTKTEPSINLDTGEITFNIPSGDDDSQSDIKISRGEESMFIWSIFYTILELAIGQLILPEGKRSINIFNDLDYIIIDDPVSSIDDTRIITLAIKIIELVKVNPILDKIEKKRKELNTQEFSRDYIKSSLEGFRNELLENDEEIKLKFLITTHHALFYNVLYNSFYRFKKSEAKKYFNILSKDDNNILEIKDQNDGSPFGYHLLIKEEIQKAINTGDIQKFHFNLFRGLLEKSSNFLGINNYKDCISGDNKDEFLRIINLYSHSSLEELEYRELPSNDKNLFIEKFNTFINEYKWQV